MSIKIVGPSSPRDATAGAVRVDTTSRALNDWSYSLSPFHLGPIPLYWGMQANVMENAWQFAKVYPDQVDQPSGEPTTAYWRWAEAGWQSPRAHRYPRGKGAKPAFLYWAGQRLEYAAARSKIYFRLYRDAVRETDAFARLQQLYRQEGHIELFDFDGYDHDALGMSLADVVLNLDRPMGHAFVLKAMLLLGEEVEPKMLEKLPKIAPVDEHSREQCCCSKACQSLGFGLIAE